MTKTRGGSGARAREAGVKNEPKAHMRMDAGRVSLEGFLAILPFQVHLQSFLEGKGVIFKPPLFRVLLLCLLFSSSRCFSSSGPLREMDLLLVQIQ